MYSYLYAYIYGIFFMADLDYKQLASNLLESLKELASGENSGAKDKASEPKGTSPAMDSMIEKAAKKLGDVATAGGAAAIGLNSVKEPALAWSKTVELMAVQTQKAFGDFQTAGKLAAETIRYIDYSRQLSVDANKVGIGQGNGQAAQGAAMGAGYDDLKDQIGAIQKYGVAQQSYGRSADDANNKFVAFGKELQDSEMAGKLKSLGLNTAREIANVAALAAAGKEEMLRTPEGRKKLAEETAALAAEIHKTAQMTNVSREDIVAEMAARKQSAQSIHEDRAYRTDAERLAADSMRSTTAGMGKSMQDITSRIAAGGYLNKTQRTELQVATGGRAGQYMAAVRDNRRTANMADNDPQKVAAKARLEREVALATANVGSSRFARQAMVTQDPDRKAAMDKMAIENREAGRLRAVMAETGKGPVEAREDMKKRAGANLEGRTQEGIDLPAGAPGTMNEAGKVSQTMQGLAENFRKNTAGMNIALGELNAQMGRFPGLLKGLTAVGTVGGAIPENMTQDQATNNNYKNLNTIKGMLGMAGGPGAEANREAATGPGADKLRNNEPQAKREHGTLGETGSPTEPKDIVARLHKGETVATPEQLKNLMAGSASNAISELMKSATTKTTATAPTGNIDISKITSGLKEITTTISSVSGGGSTTRSTVENDDAKAAKKELEAIKAQFQTEKNDIRSQVKGNLGPDAKGMDVIRAMRDNPQAKALEARMQEASAKLSERISSGTTTKTVTEPGAKSVNIANSMSQFEAQKNAESGINKISINDMMDNSLAGSLSDKLTSIKGNTEIEQPEEIAQPKEEIQLEESSNNVGLKDLNEQLVQLNTSIRQLIQYSSESVDTATKQVRATKSLSGNRFA